MAVLKLALVILVASPLVASADFVESRLVLEWRRFLTQKLLKGYYSNRAYFRLHQQVGLLDNPDQARTTLPLHSADMGSIRGLGARVCGHTCASWLAVSRCCTSPLLHILLAEH